MYSLNERKKCRCENKNTDYHLIVCCNNIKKAIDTLSTYNGKELNPDIPEPYCNAIWELIEFSQYCLKTM